MFDFVDLFAGVGGFHAALAGLGGRAVLACEIDERPAATYRHNWGLTPVGDVREVAARAHEVPDHAVLTGGFPCQPFSKSGRQRGVTDERGTLFHDIIEILRVKQPPVVLLENVRNITGPQQRGAWDAVTHGLREVGYKVSSRPCVFSPHLLHPDLGGSAQVRERVYILGVQVGVARALKETDFEPPVPRAPQPLGEWDPQRWRVAEHVLLPEPRGAERQKYLLSSDEVLWLDTWNELLARLGTGRRLPGFPLWEQCWSSSSPAGYEAMPSWKQRFVDGNQQFYGENRRTIDSWRRSNGPALEGFPASRRKLEWQAQDAERDLWKQLIQLRPSGIRVKQPTWTPALVAMNQTSIYGPSRRRLTPLETAGLQGFDPSTFVFPDQPDSLSYKQMGNAVHVGSVAHVLRGFVGANRSEIAGRGDLGRSLVAAIDGAASGTVTGAA